MKIPKKVYLLGVPIKIYLDKRKNKFCSGESSYRKNKIWLATNLKRKHLEITFLHELFHFIFYYAKEIGGYKLENGDLLQDNESLINSVSLLLHQAITSSKGKL